MIHDLQQLLRISSQVLEDLRIDARVSRSTAAAQAASIATLATAVERHDARVEAALANGVGGVVG